MKKVVTFRMFFQKILENIAYKRVGLMRFERFL